MNKRQRACEAALDPLIEVYKSEARSRMTSTLKQNVLLSNDENARAFDVNYVLSKKHNVSTGYVKKMRKLLKDDPEAFYFIFETGKDLPRTRLNGVYLISSGLPLPTKIGRTNNLPYRLSSIQTGCWVSLEVVKWMPTEEAESFEKELHNCFNKKKLHGEWFNLTKTDYDFIDVFYKTKKWYN